MNPRNPPVEISYRPAKFGRRVLANLSDFILFILLFIGLFAAARAIAGRTDAYRAKFGALTAIQMESGLFEETEGLVVDVVTKYDRKDYSDQAKALNAKKAFNKFAHYLRQRTSEDGDPEDYDVFVSDVDGIAASSSVDGKPLYVWDEDHASISRNPEVNARWDTCFNDFLKPALDNVCQSHLLTDVPGYYELTQYLSHVLFFGEIPAAYALSGLVVYLVPTFIFRKGRMTLGKAMYRIGLVDARLLNPTIGRSLARFAIFYFAVLILSPLTLGVPMIISFTLMAFSRNRQGFADYMLGLREVDVSDNVIYDTYDEITISRLNVSKKPVEFRVPTDE